MKTFDDVLQATGGFDWYQWRTYFFVCIAIFLGCLLTFTQVFTGGTGEFWCESSKFQTGECLDSNKTSKECKRLGQLASCMSYNFTFDEDEKQLQEYVKTMPCEEGWVFDHSVYRNTFTEEWELVCDKSAVTNVLQSVYLSGFLVGCTLLAFMSDRFGRYPTLVACGAMTCLSTLASAASPHPIVFGALRFCVAAFSYGLSLTSFVISTEMATPSMRVYVGIFLWIPFAIGYFVLSALGKYLNSWRLFILLTAAPFIPMILAIVYVDESPRWLLSKERYKDADKIIQKIARTNRKPLPLNYLTNLEESKDVAAKGGNMLDVLRNPVLRLYLLNLLYNWFVQSFVYYGLSLSTSSLGVDVFIAFCISGAVEIPSCIFGAFTMVKFGRKISTGGLMIFGGLACFATIFAPLGPVRVTFAMLGKFAITASFGNIYVHTAEIFPTPVRVFSVGTCSVAARVGGIIAPLILVFEKYWASLPLILFASSSILAGLLVFFLPETKGKLMPDTIEDSLNLKTLSSSKEANAPKA